MIFKQDDSSNIGKINSCFFQQILRQNMVMSWFLF